MDAIKFLEEKDRMTNKCCISCTDCPMSHHNNEYAEYCGGLTNEQKVHIVEKWSKSHPVKTRQSEFLKMFPNVAMKDGVIGLCPNQLMGIYNNNYSGLMCEDCSRKFWLEEIEEED